MELNEALSELQSLKRTIEQTVNKFGYECEDIYYDSENLDEDFTRTQIKQIAERLDDINRQIGYLSKPIITEGELTKNSEGRYELPNGYYFTSGSVCEVLYHSSFGGLRWVYTTIEHNGEDYYFTSLKNISLSGAKVRIRG
jgi:hypothetical protein